MAIEKNMKAGAAAAGVETMVSSKFDSEFSVGSKSVESMSSDDNEFRNKNVEDLDDDDDDDECDDADSGAGSDDYDLLELGETGSEFCQVGDQTCCIPYELYDLPDLLGVLSLEVWNECLTEEERFGLTKYLPDMDEETFMRTLKELFEGGNFHFGSPIMMLFKMLKGGMCEPRVALYRRGLRFFQMHQHYHLSRRHHDTMVGSLLQMKEAWMNCKGYSIEEKLRVLNIVRSQKSLMAEKNIDSGSDSERQSSDDLLGTRLKVRGNGRKAEHDPGYGLSSAFDILARAGKAVSGKVKKYSQPNVKGSMNMGGLKNPSPYAGSSHALYGHWGSIHGSNWLASRVGKAAVHDVVAASGHAEQELMYNTSTKGYWNGTDNSAMVRGRSGKKHEAPGDDECDDDSYTGLHQYAKTGISVHGRNLNINQLSDIKSLTSKPSNAKLLNDTDKRSKYVDPAFVEDARLAKGHAPQFALKGNTSGYGHNVEPYLIPKTQGEAYVTDQSFNNEYRDVDPRTFKLGNEFSDYRLKSMQPSQHMDDRIYHPEKRVKLLQENISGASIRNGGSSIFPSIGAKMFHGGEEKPSDSSDHYEEEEDNVPLIMSKQAMHGRLENSRSSMSRSNFDEKKVKQTKKSANANQLVLERMLPDNRTMANYMHRSEFETYSSRSRQKYRMNNLDTSQNFMTRMTQDSYYGGSENSYIESDHRPSYRLGRNGQVLADLAENPPMSMHKPSPMERWQKGTVGRDYYNMGHEVGFIEGNPKGKGSIEDLNVTLAACTSSGKKKKRKELPTEMAGPDGSYYLPSHHMLSDNIPSKNWAKKRLEAEFDSPAAITSEVPIIEVAMAEPEPEPEVIPQKKILPPITPTIHTGFSFSIIHLLSSVRVALITPRSENAQKHVENAGVEVKEQSAEHESADGSKHESADGSKHESADPSLEQPNLNTQSTEKFDVNNQGTEKSNANNLCTDKSDVKIQSTEKSNLPSLTLQEIVNCVRSNPGDPCILETPEPLQDLVRGVLKIFSSKSAPLGAKAWKPLICYEKSSKCWSWTGPVPESSTDLGTPEEVISPEAWSVPHKMLVKLVDSYASWLKSGQETLQQIGSLPPPPAELMQLNIDEKERFKDLRAQKSLITITRSSDEVRDYFRKEEQLRYSIPDRAFSYTAADGKKTIVAPLRRCGGKPTSKARDHFMLKRDRPPHVTILCLVRDAAARLPGNIGTRADVCTLIRDSQFIVEDVTDAQVNQVVSGALDRLHYERDPCVQFDGERKLWVYLHRDRDEEDFEDDGTSSTKKWKRPKKETSEQDDQVTVACAGNMESNGLDLVSDLNVAPTCSNGEKPSVVLNDDTRQRTGDDGKAGDVASETDFQQLLESQLQCQENSTNEVIDDET